MVVMVPYESWSSYDDVDNNGKGRRYVCGCGSGWDSTDHVMFERWTSRCCNVTLVFCAGVLFPTHPSPDSSRSRCWRISAKEDWIISCCGVDCRFDLTLSNLVTIVLIFDGLNSLFVFVCLSYRRRPSRSNVFLVTKTYRDFGVSISETVVAL